MHKVVFVSRSGELEWYFRTRYFARRKFNKLLRDYEYFDYKLKHIKISNKGNKLIDCKVRG